MNNMALLLLNVVFSQTIHVDWTSVVNAETGETTSEPHVDLPFEHQPDLEQMSGYFANSDGFYGRPDHVEVVQVRSEADGRIEALKLVGDHNVPRGRLSFRSTELVALAPTWSYSIQLQLRDDISSDDAFWWSPGGSHEVMWLRDYSAFYLVGTSPGKSKAARFHRLTQDEASNYERTVQDAA